MLVAKELEILNSVALTQHVEPPEIWKDNGKFKLFLSHLAIDKQYATRLKTTLLKYNISCFVAHEDIEPTKKWQIEIEKALWFMDAMVTIHTKGFSESVWTQQEIGFALGRGVKIISLKMGTEDPKGFISNEQAISRRQRNAEQVSEEINTLLTNDLLTKHKMEEVYNLNKAVQDDDDVPF